MAIAVVMDFTGGTVEQYDEACRRLGFEPKGPGAPGGLFHWAASTEGGLRITDVWQDKETWEAFTADKLTPVSTEIGIPAPEVAFYEVYNYQTQGPAL